MAKEKKFITCDGNTAAAQAEPLELSMVLFRLVH